MGIDEKYIKDLIITLKELNYYLTSLEKEIDDLMSKIEESEATVKVDWRLP